MNKPFLDEDFKTAYDEVNSALTDMEFYIHDSVIEKIINRIDKELKDLEKYIDATYAWSALDYAMYPESKKRNKTMETITLDNACMINKKIYERGTTFCIKEKSNSESDIILDRSYRVNDIILQEGEIISLFKNKINENYSYYKKELDHLTPIDEYGLTFVVQGGGKKTKSINLNEESLKALNDFFKENF